MSDQADVAPENLPVVPLEAELRRDLPLSLKILSNDEWYQRIKQVSNLMANDHVTMPKHLHDKPAACFSILMQAYNWNMDPMFVARNTYMTPGGQIGFMGKLVQGILEQSGRFVGGPKVKYVGDWSKVTGKFTKRQNQYGKDFIVPSWTDKDAQGLGIIVSWQMRGETEPRVWPAEDEPFYLTQCFPLNSPLWATDPRTQIRYLAMRRFADQATPATLGGMPFDAEDLIDASDRAHNITPETERPRRQQYEAPAADPVDVYEVVDHLGEAVSYPGHAAASAAWCAALDAALKERGADGVLAVWENSAALMDELESRGHGDLTQKMGTYYAEVRERAGRSSKDIAAEKEAEERDRKEAAAAAPTAEPPKQNDPAPEVRPAKGQQQPSLLDERPTLFSGTSWTIDRTVQPNGKHNWAVMRDQLLALVGHCRAEPELDKLLADNAALIASFKSEAPAFFVQFSKGEDLRRQQLGKA